MKIVRLVMSSFANLEMHENWHYSFAPISSVIPRKGKPPVFLTRKYLLPLQSFAFLLNFSNIPCSSSAKSCLLGTLKPAHEANFHSKVIYKPGGYFMIPEGKEKIGDVSNLILSNGWIPNEKRNVFMYYASSDTMLHVATDHWNSCWIIWCKHHPMVTVLLNQ